MYAENRRSKNKQVDNIDTEITTIQVLIGGYWILITVVPARMREAARRSQRGAKGSKGKFRA
jgi:hypothetical protein